MIENKVSCLADCLNLRIANGLLLGDMENVNFPMLLPLII